MYDTNKIIIDVTTYYEEKFRKNGPTPQGVDWNSKESQELRFLQLLKLIENNDRCIDFSILDYGCGYGAFIDYLKKNYQNFNCTGYDSSKLMIEQAIKLHPDAPNCWIDNIDNIKKVDYVVASGVFNIKLDYSNKVWSQYIFETLEHFNELSIKGFSFNILTKYSDKEYMKDHLFYADPLVLFEHCKRKYSKYIALLHDYPLYEFTIIVRKEN